MLNNITNFFNIFKGRMTKTSPTDGDIIALGTRDPRFGGHYKPTAILVKDFEATINPVWGNIVGTLADQTDLNAALALKQPYAVAATGTNITFAVPQVYNTRTTPATGNLTNTLTGARIGVVQKIYHNSLIAPSMPAGWTLVGEGFYIPGSLNIIYAEWSEGTTVEYWVTQ